MNNKLRNRRLVILAALVIGGIASVDTTYAQTAFSREITLPDVISTSAMPTTSIEPGLINLDSIKSVNAHVMALVSYQTKQVQLAETPDGAKQVAADLIAMDYPKWNTTSQVGCLNELWNGESHWNFKAHNYRSGAHGIPQALPATKMSLIATDWRTNPVTQIRWGLRYIDDRYHTPCAALRFKHARHHY